MGRTGRTPRTLGAALAGDYKDDIDRQGVPVEVVEHNSYRAGAGDEQLGAERLSPRDCPPRRSVSAASTRSSRKSSEDSVELVYM